jgi:hypothetical protein
VLVVFALLWLYFTTSPQAACPNTEPDVTPNPVLASACPEFHQVELGNGYTREVPGGPAGWVELALPSGRWLVHSSECMLTPWTVVRYHSSDPHLADLNDCALDAWLPQSDAPCAQDAQGQCDINLDQSYLYWLNNP